MIDVFNQIIFVHGAVGHGGGVAGSVEHLLERIEHFTSGGSEGLFDTFMPGISNMPNLHPLFVHLPIVLILIFFLFDVYGSLTRNSIVRKFAGWLLYMGAASVCMTIIAGYNAAESVTHNEAAHRIMEQHELYALIVAGITILLTVWRLVAGSKLQGFVNGLYLTMSAAACFILILGADLGALMVYHHGVGVAKVSQPFSEKLSHDHSHVESPEYARESMP